MKVIVTGAGGFIGAHLCRRLKADGHFVRGLSRSPWDEHRHGPNPCDEYWTCDLRKSWDNAFLGVDECYQLACQVGGLGFIGNERNASAILRDSTLIDINVLEGCRFANVQRVFFASSACVYPNVRVRSFREYDAYSRTPNNPFGWQKLFAEQLYQSYGDRLQVRIGRLFNTYGPGLPWGNGREKVVGALCRKVAGATSMLAMWGDGQQRRSFTYVDDAVEGIVRLMRSDCPAPVNIGLAFEYTIDALAEHIMEIAGKDLPIKYELAAPTGVPSICCDTEMLKKVLQWEPHTSLEQGLKKTYPWVEKQVLTTAGKT